MGGRLVIATGVIDKDLPAAEYRLGIGRPGFDCAGTFQQVTYAGNPEQEVVEQRVDGFSLAPLAPPRGQKDRDVRRQSDHPNGCPPLGRVRVPAVVRTLSPPTENTPHTVEGSVARSEGMRDHGRNPPEPSSHRLCQSSLNYAPPLGSEGRLESEVGGQQSPQAPSHLVSDGQNDLRSS